MGVDPVSWLLSRGVMGSDEFTVVHMDSLKWPDRPHWRYDMTRVGDDEYGVWLWAGPDTIAQHGSDPPRRRGIGFVTLIPPNEWWLAMFFADHPVYDTYVNVGTPCTWSENTVSQIDLDLDVVRYHNGSCAVIDEDEFEDRKTRLGYPPRLVEQASDAAARALRLLETDAEPFRNVSADWLAIALEKR